MDAFEQKRGMVQKLMGMLKKSAADEVGGYSEKKQVTHTPLPTERPNDKPHVKDSFKAGSKPVPSPKPMEGTTMGNDSAIPMSKGGMVDLSKSNDLQQRTSDDHMMAEGGMAGTDMSVSDEASRLTEPVSDPSSDGQNEEALSNLPEAPQDEQGEEADRQKQANKNMEYEDEDNNSSSFEAFFPRKRKK